MPLHLICFTYTFVTLRCLRYILHSVTLRTRGHVWFAGSFVARLFILHTRYDSAVPVPVAWFDLLVRSPPFSFCTGYTRLIAFCDFTTALTTYRATPRSVATVAVCDHYVTHTDTYARYTSAGPVVFVDVTVPPRTTHLPPPAGCWGRCSCVAYTHRCLPVTYHVWIPHCYACLPRYHTVVVDPALHTTTTRTTHLILLHVVIYLPPRTAHISVYRVTPRNTPTHHYYRLLPAYGMLFTICSTYVHYRFPTPHHTDRTTTFPMMHC